MSEDVKVGDIWVSVASFSNDFDTITITRIIRVDNIDGANGLVDLTCMASDTGIEHQAGSEMVIMLSEVKKTLGKECLYNFTDLIKPKTICSCELFSLMNRGCGCGAIMKERSL